MTILQLDAAILWTLLNHGRINCVVLLLCFSSYITTKLHNQYNEKEITT